MSSSGINGFPSSLTRRNECNWFWLEPPALVTLCGGGLLCPEASPLLIKDVGGELLLLRCRSRSCSSTALPEDNEGSWLLLGFGFSISIVVWVEEEDDALPCEPALDGRAGLERISSSWVPALLGDPLLSMFWFCELLSQPLSLLWR
ncbi:hypothetical protein PPTG_23590 [Phytophthora nicotianae INRA-310]|uniref:Uncharacterized protein n=1 Tax=Phytophthora nicotianae (strain INRA-310) TaxID=761204 RepID=W2PVY7_PHYN3|nr:hypothetical protein PPTG_23590 [Phytophthora nicotianae INRA-310]ETN04781.1 hypothetical protein PPTG_23590 [Phytophthora nicotianae INRA-310]